MDIYYLLDVQCFSIAHYSNLKPTKISKTNAVRPFKNRFNLKIPHQIKPSRLCIFQSLFKKSIVSPGHCFQSSSF